jgi:L-rhamnose mutarotase
MGRAHFTNYSIFHYPEASMLVGYFEWTGTDWDADMQSVADDEETQRWWKVTDSMQESLVSSITRRQSSRGSDGGPG